MFRVFVFFFDVDQNKFSSLRALGEELDHQKVYPPLPVPDQKLPFFFFAPWVAPCT